MKYIITSYILGRRRAIKSIAEMAKNTEVERGAAEQQMTTYQRANSYQDDTVKNAT
jgi:hypothetical protein